ncbi:hypothetical protein L7F22_035798, partial [Adiantum nelumboides]|nr:hypothetical protein [Adiantum nelumboides]
HQKRSDFCPCSITHSTRSWVHSNPNRRSWNVLPLATQSHVFVAHRLPLQMSLLLCLKSAWRTYKSGLILSQSLSKPK